MAPGVAMASSGFEILERLQSPRMLQTGITSILLQRETISTRLVAWKIARRVETRFYRSFTNTFNDFIYASVTLVYRIHVRGFATVTQVVIAFAGSHRELVVRKRSAKV